MMCGEPSTTGVRSTTASGRTVRLHNLDYDGGEIYSLTNLNQETPATNG
jgi:hypothetical protein